jgi:hypothetical protein
MYTWLSIVIIIYGLYILQLDMRLRALEKREEIV